MDNYSMSALDLRLRPELARSCSSNECEWKDLFWNLLRDISQSVLPKRCHKIRERKKRPCWTREKDRMCRVELHGTDGLIGLKTDRTEEVQSIWVWFRCYMMIFISVISCPLKFNSCQILSSQRGNEQMKLKFLGAKPKHAVYKELMH